MPGLFLIALATLLAIVVYTAGMVGVVVLMREHVNEIALFLGPTLLRTRMWGVEVRLNSLPFGSSVRLQREVQALPVAKAAFCALGGPLALLMCSGVTLGLADGYGSFLRGFHQFLAGALMPRTFGGPALTGLAQHAGFLVVLGTVSAKLAACNLLPFPGFSGELLLRSGLRFMRLSLPSWAFTSLWALWVLSVLGWTIALVVAVTTG